MDLESIMLSERNQRLKATYCMILFLGNVQNRQICRDRKQMYSCQWVERKKELRSMGFPSVMMEMFRNDMVVMVTQHCEYSKTYCIAQCDYAI